MDKSKIVYKEPAGYIPKELRKKYRLGEFNDDIDKKKGQPQELAHSDDAASNREKEALRKQHALLDIQHATEYNQRVIDSDAPEEIKMECREQLQRLAAMKRRIESDT